MMTTENITTTRLQGLFAGRLGRLNFFIGNLILALCFTIPAFILTIAGLMLAFAASGWLAFLILLGFVLVVVGLIIGTSMVVRRLHDFGQSGVWMFAFVLLGLSIFLIPLQWFFIFIVLLIPGDEHSNHYGTPPPCGFSLAKTWFNR